MGRLLLLVVSLFIVSGFANAEVDLNSATLSVDATSAEALKATQPERSWYAGATLGYALLEGWDSYPVTSYYFSKGYYRRDSSVEDSVMHEWNVYTGYRFQEHVDIEMGFSKSGSSTRIDFESWSNEKIRSVRWLRSRAIYLATLLRPAARRSKAGFYFKFGLHASQFEIEKSVSGTPANLGTIAAGDKMENDGMNFGFGALVGLGFDIRIGDAGAVRLEINHYDRLGGTSYNKNGLNFGYQANF
jgi:hypothetical protein